MAFTSTITGRDVVGSKVRTWGTYASSGSGTGGDIDTGIHSVDFMLLSPVGSAVGTNVPKVNETLPIAGSAVTIITDADEIGNWQAFGDYF